MSSLKMGEPSCYCPSTVAPFTELFTDDSHKKIGVNQLGNQLQFVSQEIYPN